MLQIKKKIKMILYSFLILVQASIDLESRVFMPIHWAKYDLSYHNWDEPIIRVTYESEKKNVTVATPLIGEIFNLKELP